VDVDTATEGDEYMYTIPMNIYQQVTHTHAPTENNTPDTHTHTHTHDKNNTPNPQTNTAHTHLTTLEGGATTVLPPPTPGWVAAPKSGEPGFTLKGGRGKGRT